MFISINIYIVVFIILFLLTYLSNVKIQTKYLFIWTLLTLWSLFLSFILLREVTSIVSITWTTNLLISVILEELIKWGIWCTLGYMITRYNTSDIRQSYISSTFLVMMIFIIIECLSYILFPGIWVPNTALNQWWPYYRLFLWESTHILIWCIGIWWINKLYTNDKWWVFLYPFLSWIVIHFISNYLLWILQIQIHLILFIPIILYLLYKLHIHVFMNASIKRICSYIIVVIPLVLLWFPVYHQTVENRIYFKPSIVLLQDLSVIYNEVTEQLHWKSVSERMKILSDNNISQENAYYNDLLNVP